ncbi:MAG: hypothetical protein M3404_12195, partial [Actinomycetota bacterium]|nr:hypothetical protein [Actinomycetota bacterium]
MYDALSFCADSYVGIGCAASFDDTGDRVWESWTVGKTQFWSNRVSWLVPMTAPADARIPRQQTLEMVMPRILDLSLRDPWSRKGVVRHLVASLCEGTRGNSVEIRLAT